MEHKRSAVSSSMVLRVLAWIILGVIVVAVAALIFFGLRVSRETGISPSLGMQLVAGDGVELKSSAGRTNILLLGVGGGTHEGADLTDTMMVVSLSTTGQSASFVSIPRDIWSETLKDRVNSAYHYGELKKEGGGLLLAKVVAEDVIGMPIQYSMLVDFSGFTEIIDLVGGIDVNITKGFVDHDYPIAGKEKDTCPGDPTNRCVYETIQFDVGVERMNGERALKYVRSRHAEGEEGTDFARSRRQQDVIIALKDKLMQPTQWFTPTKGRELLDVVEKATESDMNLGEIASIGKRMLKIDDANIHKVSIDELLYSPPTSLYGRYVLIPLESWDQVHTFIQEKLKSL
jgi:polyisoprenyl-teichoic acid--peptidoglycan teichoic acid transferase